MDSTLSTKRDFVQGPLDSTSIVQSTPKTTNAFSIVANAPSI